MASVSPVELGVVERAVRFPLITEQTGSTEIEIPYATIGEQPDSLFLTGLGEGDVACIAERLASHGVSKLAVASLVYPEVTGYLEGDTVKASITGGLEALASSVTTAGRRLRRGIGISEGASQVMLATIEDPELFEEVIAISPGCLNNKDLGDNPKQRMRKLHTRFKKAGLIDALEVQDGWKSVAQGMRGGLTYADRYTGREREVVSALGSKLRIYVGGKDTIFPEKECVDGVGRENLTVLDDMGHPSLSTDTGASEIAGVILRDDAGELSPVL